MTSELGQWQERLDERFSELADLRQGTLYRVRAVNARIKDPSEKSGHLQVQVGPAGEIFSTASAIG